MEALPTKFVVSEHVLSSVADAVGPRHVAGRACFVAFTYLHRIIRIKVRRLHSDIPENCCVILMLRLSQRRGRTRGEVGGGRVCRGVSPLV